VGCLCSGPPPQNYETGAVCLLCEFLRLYLCVMFGPYLALGQQMLSGVGPYKVPPDGNHNGFDRGMQTTMYCGNDPESWFRGSAQLNKDTGRLEVTLQLETDSMAAGPKGKIHIVISGATEQTVLWAQDTGEESIAGKKPGKARIVNLSKSFNVPVDAAQKATKVYVEAYCTGKQTTYQPGDIHINRGGGGRGGSN